MIEKPVWFRLFDNTKHGTTEHQMLVCSSFIEAIRCAKQWPNGKPHQFTFMIEFKMGDKMFVPQPVYAYPAPETRKDAVNFIRKREERVKAVEAVIKKLSYEIRSYGNDRSCYSDPLERQVADYIATSPWKWRSDDYLSGVRFLRQNLDKVCQFCDFSAEKHPFVEQSSRLRRLCGGQLFVL